MKGNPFFTQLRPGKDEKIFRLIKFRTMTCETDANGNPLPDEQRLVPYGRFLHLTSLDELPELFNILKGWRLSCLVSRATNLVCSMKISRKANNNHGDLQKENNHEG